MAERSGTGNAEPCARRHSRTHSAGASQPAQALLEIAERLELAAHLW